MSYFDKIIRETHIQEWFVGEPVSQKAAVDCIIESYPPPLVITRDDIKKWVKNEVDAYNSDVVDDCHKLPEK